MCSVVGHVAAAQLDSYQKSIMPVVLSSLIALTFLDFLDSYTLQFLGQ